MRLPYAADTFIAQVVAQKAAATVEFGEPDGFDVARTIKFDKRTSKWLTPLMEVMDDQRIAETHLTEAGYLHITFANNRSADDDAEFPFDAAKEVAAAHRGE